MSPKASRSLLTATATRWTMGLVVGLVASLGLGSSSQALAKTSRKVSHPYEKVWPASVRYLRIDAGLTLIEKDVDSGYVLFELSDEGRSFRGAMELVRRKDAADRDAVELIIDIKDRPSYMEHALLDKMLKKIRLELGHPKNSEPAPAKDDDAEAGES